MINEDAKAVRSCGNVFRDLGFDDEEAENLRIRTLLMLEIEEYIRRQNITRAQVSRRFGMTSSQVGNLLSGKLDLFTIDMLVNMLARAGVRLNIAVQREDATDSGLKSIPVLKIKASESIPRLKAQAG